MHGTEDILRLLLWLWHMPLSSETQLRYVSGLGLSATQTLISHALQRGFICELPEGRTRRVKTRYFLHGLGVREVMRHFGMALEWQVTEAGLRSLLASFRAVEPTYDVMIRLFRSNAILLPAEFPLDASDDPALLRLNGRTRQARFRWMRPVRRGFRPHGIAEYQTEADHRLWIPVYWYGYHHKKMAPLAEMAQLYQGLKTMDAPWLEGIPASPIGIVVICLDDFAAWRASTELADLVPAAIVTADGKLFRQMDPVSPFGIVHRTTGRPGAVGAPERVGDPDGLDARTLATRGKTRTRISEFVENFPGAKTHELERAVRIRKKPEEDPIDQMEKADVIRKIGDSFYSGREGIAHMYERDRAPEGVVPGDYSTYLDPDSKYRQQQLWHDRTHVKLYHRFAEMGILVVQGRRLQLQFKTDRAAVGVDTTTMKPDLWVPVPVGGTRVVWHTLELERSVAAVTGMEQKRRSHLAAEQEGKPTPLLLLCDGDSGNRMAAEERRRALTRMFGGLPMISTTLGEFLNGNSYGPDSVWRMGERAEIVSFDHLARRFDESGVSTFIQDTLGELRFL